MKDFDQEMWQDFVVEVEENLQEFEPNLLLLEQQPDDSSILNDCFRNMHSIKGAANYMGLSSTAALAHAIENLFDKARQGNRRLDQQAFDLIFKGVDRFKELLADIAQHHEERLGVEDLLDQLKALANQEEGLVDVPSSEKEAETVAETEDSDEDQELLNIFAQEMRSLYEQLVRVIEDEDADQGTLDILLQDMERVSNYIGKEELHSAISAIRQGLFDSFQREGPGEFLETLRSSVRDALSKEIELDDVLGDAQPGATGVEIEEDEELYNIFLDFFKEVGAPLANPPVEMNEEWISECEEAVNKLKISANYMDYMDVVHLLEEWEECITEQLSRDAHYDREVFKGLWDRLCDRLPNLRQMFEAAEVDQSEGGKALESSGQKETDTVMGLDSLDDFDAAIDTIFEDEEPAAEAQKAQEVQLSSPPEETGKETLPQFVKEDDMGHDLRPSERASGSSDIRGQGQLVRVNLEKVENLLEDVAELVVLRSSMVQSTTMLKGLYSRWRDQRKMAVQELRPLKDVLLDFTESVAALERVVHQLQDGVMRMRMLPVSSLFNRYPRMVRDLCRKLGKEVELKLKGMDTALDKQVMEQLADPLQHIIRNAIDHGIEPPDYRSRKGKPSKGQLSIAASQEGNFVIISVSDDGRGLDRDKIIKKAISSGVINADALRDMNEEQIWNLVFVPGISTAGSVSDISGRGVGLDVVKKNIEKIGGAVVVQSQKGKGTRFILRIPLTLAIIKGLTVKVGRQSMVVPISAVYETFRLTSQEVSSVEGYEIISKRQETLPLIRLGRIFRGTGAPAEPEKFFAVRVRLGELDACLGVDALIGQQEVVIKPLSEYLMDQPGFAGATILGDGSIALILDLPAVLEKSKGFIRKRQQLLEQAALGLDQPDQPMFH